MITKLNINYFYNYISIFNCCQKTFLYLIYFYYYSNNFVSIRLNYLKILNLIYIFH